MLFGPIFSVEMTTSARRARYFLVRAIYAVIVFLVLFSVYVDVFRYDDLTDISTIARYAATFFLAFSVVQLGAVFLIGPAMVVGTIATERERRTIEYLFASQLSNVEIVLGKLAARLLHVAYLVLAGLPILALAMLLGGISPEVLLMIFVITLSSIVLVGWFRHRVEL
jgi:ABC-type transport system involved in multi-copper enzyme maturation permease subunit